MPQLTVQVHDCVGTITLDRPERRNALTRQLLQELLQALDDLYADKRVRAIVLTGAGTAFCAGMDLGEMRETAQQPNAQELWGEDAENYRRVVTRMMELTKPIIAAVNGPAVAGGGGLVVASDIVVACAEARYGLPEPRRGIIAGVVAPVVAFRIGAGQAARLLLTSQLIEASEAYRIGLYHELVPAEKVWARAFELAKECAAGAPEALLLTKRLINDTIGETIAAQLAAGSAASGTARTTEAAAEGLTAFLEKRAPEWK